MNPSSGASKPPGLNGKDRLSLRFRRHFLTGILVVTPAAVAGWVLYRLLAWVDGLLWDQMRFGWVRPGGIPGVGLVTVVLLVLLVGLLVNNYVGRRFYQTWDYLLTRIPLFNKIYVAVKQIGEALLSSNRTVFRAVGLIEYPRKGIWSLVFLTEKPNPEIEAAAEETLRSVFLPTTPNPTSGFLLMVPEKDLIRLSMTVEDGLKMVISGGAYVPGESELGLQRRVPRPARRRRWWQRGPFARRRLPADMAEDRLVEADPPWEAGPPGYAGGEAGREAPPRDVPPRDAPPRDAPPRDAPPRDGA